MAKKKGHYESIAICRLLPPELRTVWRLSVLPLEVRLHGDNRCTPLYLYFSLATFTVGQRIKYNGATKRKTYLAFKGQCHKKSMRFFLTILCVSGRLKKYTSRHVIFYKNYLFCGFVFTAPRAYSNTDGKYTRKRVLDEVQVTWTFPFGGWYGFFSFHLADPVSEHFCASTIASQSALTQLQI